ncbi:hypothetical protein NKG94_13035 [Micromonospora sp. M12]
MAFRDKDLSTPGPIMVDGRQLKRYHIDQPERPIEPEVEKAAYDLLPALLADVADDGTRPPGGWCCTGARTPAPTCWRTPGCSTTRWRSASRWPGSRRWTARRRPGTLRPPAPNGCGLRLGVGRSGTRAGCLGPAHAAAGESESDQLSA